MKRPVKTPLIKRAPTQRLRATAQRAAKYEEREVEEPNVRLSRAFVVVLLLHVVAVGGIFAFSALKDRQQGGGTSATKARLARETLQANTVNAPGQGELTSAANSLHRVRTGETLSGIAAANGVSTHDLELANSLRPGAAIAPGKDLLIPDKTLIKPVPLDVQKLIEAPKPPPAAKATGAAVAEKGDEGPRTYQVQRGDTPASIARKLKVSAIDLLKVNNLEDPRKLQVGQKLIVP
ncbi:MAG TPA: LysM peptidoglycan-binding domain-containing protein [Chthoniobacterales bacterium]